MRATSEPLVWLDVKVENTPGVLTRLATRLSEAGVEIGGLIAAPASDRLAPARDGAGEGPAAAIHALAEAGITILYAYELAGSTRRVALLVGPADAANALATLRGWPVPDPAESSPETCGYEWPGAS